MQVCVDGPPSRRGATELIPPLRRGATELIPPLRRGATELIPPSRRGATELIRKPRPLAGNNVALVAPLRTAQFSSRRLATTTVSIRVCPMLVLC